MSDTMGSAFAPHSWMVSQRSWRRNRAFPLNNRAHGNGDFAEKAEYGEDGRPLIDGGGTNPGQEREPWCFLSALVSGYGRDEFEKPSYPLGEAVSIHGDMCLGAILYYSDQCDEEPAVPSGKAGAVKGEDIRFWSVFNFAADLIHRWKFPAELPSAGDNHDQGSVGEPLEFQLAWYVWCGFLGRRHVFTNFYGGSKGEITNVFLILR